MREWLKVLRMQHRETVGDVAKAVGVSEEYYARIETGDRQRKIDIVLLTLLSRHFNVPLSEMVSFE